MSEQQETPNPLDPFDTWTAMRDAGLKSWTAMRDANLEALSKMLIDLVNSEAYSQATSQWLDGSHAAHNAFMTLSLYSCAEGVRSVS